MGFKMWNLRKWLIKKLAGRQTVVLNSKMLLPLESGSIEDFYISIKGHYKKYLVDNVDVVDKYGKTVNYEDL